MAMSDIICERRGAAGFVLLNRPQALNALNHDMVQALDAALEARLRAAIRAGCSPRHVPAVILPVADIPRTKSGKITELAVRRVVMGQEVKNTEALANPEALELFRGLAALGG